jgi:thiamine biosynthesis lipoprotein
LKISDDTEAIFDITVSPLVDAWGFGVRRTASFPDSSNVDSLLMCTGRDKLVLYQDRLIKSLACVKIDVNGIAQGYSVDVIADFLNQNKISDYLVEVGGEIKTRGQKQPLQQSFVVGLEGPSESDDEKYVITKKVVLENCALTTSGNYRKFSSEGNKKRSHLINPKTGYPIDNEMISVTVLAKDAMTADGYDNVFMGMGMEKSMKFLSKQESLEAYMIYYNAEGVVADTATVGFYKLMR